MTVVVATAVFVVEFGEPFRNACAIATGFFVVECDFLFDFGFLGVSQKKVFKDQYFIECRQRPGNIEPKIF